MTYRDFLRPPIISPKRAQAEWQEWLMRWEWDRFVTLTFNGMGFNPSDSARSESQVFKLKDTLKEWDQRMQRRVIGTDWQKYPEYQLFCTYALEKTDTNPHWHGLVHFFDCDELERARQGAAFDKHASAVWTELVPAGDAVFEPIYNRDDAIKYIGKSLTTMINFEHWVAPDEFRYT